MNTLHITVNQKRATYSQRDGDIVCGNGDYQIQFTFDDEWKDVQSKTARFIWNGQYFDVYFTGDTCGVPVITNTDYVLIGVYSEELQTTTSARIKCRRSILCGAEPPYPYYTDATNKAVADILDIAQRAEQTANEAKAAVDGTGPDTISYETIDRIILGLYEGIAFYVDGVKYDAKPGMTWDDFIHSVLNPKDEGGSPIFYGAPDVVESLLTNRAVTRLVDGEIIRVYISDYIIENCMYQSAT